MTREIALGLSGHTVTREQRKELMLADLRDAALTRDELIARRDKILGRIKFLTESHARQVANGMPVTAETLRRNLARPQLELEVFSEVIG